MNIVVIGLGSMGKRRVRLIKELYPDYSVIGVDGREDRRIEAEEKFMIGTQKSRETLQNRKNFYLTGSNKWQTRERKRFAIGTNPEKHLERIITCNFLARGLGFVLKHIHASVLGSVQDKLINCYAPQRHSWRCHKNIKR